MRNHSRERLDSSPGALQLDPVHPLQRDPHLPRPTHVHRLQNLNSKPETHGLLRRPAKAHRDQLPVQQGNQPGKHRPLGPDLLSALHVGNLQRAQNEPSAEALGSTLAGNLLKGGRTLFAGQFETFWNRAQKDQKWGQEDQRVSIHDRTHVW